MKHTKFMKDNQDTSHATKEIVINNKTSTAFDWVFSGIENVYQIIIIKRENTKFDII